MQNRYSWSLSEQKSPYTKFDMLVHALISAGAASSRIGCHVCKS